MTDQQLNRIFISYAQKDTLTADAIVEALQGLKLTPWIDRKEIKPGDSFVEKMNEGLSQAAYVIVLISAAALASRWVSREWMSSVAAKEKVVIPVLLEECVLPPLLRDILYVDLRTDRASGLARLRSLFENEGMPVSNAPEKLRAPEAAELLTTSRQTLRRIALRCMGEDAYKSLLFDLHIDPGQIPGNSLHERIINLLFWVGNSGELEYVATWLPSEPTCRRCVANEIRKLQ
ncbi:toll/interleukin-1 receptor domain-containing protein [Nitrospira sp. BLG_2]|uniref:toll/interleukin-1 receptor domain-containing protein n=1 Tax=Nitrospira sp. BLG_2 TaxID=3397507 RepID=UPI003B9B4146